MNNSEEKVPKVFISYSHDTPAHKKWVGELASKLVENGIDVILDQWDLGLGDDVAKFMERAVTEADRVLMICTETYVRKADGGVGGVGYEAMIVTGELVRDLGTSKFIPVIRQKPGNDVLPKAVSTRFYINLSEGQAFKEQFEILLRELHQAPSISKPPIGKNPFARQPSGVETPASISEGSVIPDLSKLNQDVVAIYKTALELARQGDIVAWRKIIRQAKQPIPDQLNGWRVKHEESPPVDKGELPQLVSEGTSIYAPLFSIALAGVESGRDKFNNQVSVLDEILHPKGWKRSGLPVIVYIHDAVAFIYQALHGGMCLQTDQLSIAMNLAKAKFERGYENESRPLYKIYHIIGWPDSLAGKADSAWNFLIQLPERWSWLGGLFGEPDDYQASVCAYYMSLNILELADTVTSGNEGIIAQENIRLDVPLCCMKRNKDVQRKAYRLLISNPEQVRGIWRNLGVSDSKMETLWPSWISHANKWLSSTYHYEFYYDIIHKDLFKDLA